MESFARWALVLAGGDGTRLQDLTREISGAPIPKQYCPLLGDRTLFEATLLRSRHFAGRGRAVAVVNRNHLDVCAAQLSAFPAADMVVQPCNRDTGPGILLGLLEIAARNRDAIVVVLPSDHFVGDDAAFMAYVRRAGELLATWPEKVVLLGVLPEEPDTELGYISPGRRLSAGMPAFAVNGFNEKPSERGAGDLIRDGALWNSFVMVFRVRRMLDLLRDIVPREFEQLHQMSGSAQRLARGYRELEAWNFSQRFLSKIAAHLIVLKVQGVHWSDWGTRASIDRSLRKLNQPPPWLRGSVASAA